jgi:hypothetical protein
MIFRSAAAVLAVLGLAGAAVAEPTAVTVRAVSKDAKFIGDSMGGVAITLTEARTGRRLAEGLTAGATGDTGKLVSQPRVRGQPLSTPGAAAFVATLDIDRPTLVRAEAKGPVGKPDAAVTVTSMMWILPGRPVAGDGWMIEMPGLVVEPTVAFAAGDAMTVTAKVTLMCGCPIEPGGLWDAARYEVRASLMQADKVVKGVALAYAGQPSTFTVSIPDVASGAYRLVVTAHDPATGNTGVVERDIRVG